MTRQPSISDEALAALQAMATARTNGDMPTSAPEAFAVKLPLMARVAAEPKRMLNIPVCEADFDEYSGRPFDAEAWLAQRRPTFDDPAFENVHPTLVEIACRRLAEAAEGGRGMVQWTYDQWAGFTGCCRATIHKIVRGLWATEGARIGGAYYWAGRERRRAMNRYFPKMLPDVAQEAIVEAVAPEAAAPAPAAPEPAAAPDLAARAVARLAGALQDLASWLPKLVARAHGLNTTPIRTERAAPA